MSLGYLALWSRPYTRIWSMSDGDDWLNLLYNTGLSDDCLSRLEVE